MPTGTPKDEVFVFEGRELPVWTYQHWQHLESFLDGLCPQGYTASIRERLYDEAGFNGVVYKHDPLTVGNAVAVYRITNPEPQ